MKTTTHAAGFTTHKGRALRTSPRPNPYAAYRVVRGVVLINAAKSPEFHVDTHTCPKCRIKEYRTGMVMRVAYSHKTTTAKHCDECEGDRIAMIGIALERQGVPLGWGYIDAVNLDYVREQADQGKRLARIGRIE